MEDQHQVRSKQEEELCEGQYEHESNNSRHRCLRGRG